MKTLIFFKRYLWGSAIFALWTLFFVFVLFCGALENDPGNVLSFYLEHIAVIIASSSTQWMVVGLLGFYTLVSIFICGGSKTAIQDFGRRELWISCLCIIALFVYGRNYDTASKSTNAAIFLFGLFLICGIITLNTWCRCNQLGVALPALITTLVTVSVCNVPNQQIYRYQGVERWSGPWGNPNDYGLLMGLGLVLVAGWAASGFLSSECGVRNAKRRTWLKTALLLFAAGMMVLGLLKSYSRGAWVAAVCGGLYLASQSVRRLECQVRNWMRQIALPVAIIVVSILVVGFCEFRQTEKPVARRALSVRNVNDFSWRNRLTSWEGTLAMMADRPWLGFGWNRPELAYAYFYRPAKLVESGAIHVNDYLMLGSTLGVPALVCFVVYVWRRLVRSAECGITCGKPDWGRQKAEARRLNGTSWSGCG